MPTDGSDEESAESDQRRDHPQEERPEDGGKLGPDEESQLREDEIIKIADNNPLDLIERLLPMSEINRITP